VFEEVKFHLKDEYNENEVTVCLKRYKGKYAMWIFVEDIEGEYPTCVLLSDNVKGVIEDLLVFLDELLLRERLEKLVISAVHETLKRAKDKGMIDEEKLLEAEKLLLVRII